MMSLRVHKGEQAVTELEEVERQGKFADVSLFTRDRPEVAQQIKDLTEGVLKAPSDEFAAGQSLTSRK